MSIRQTVVAGQRWVSDSEPELGLGMIIGVATGRVEISFPAASERRQYALSTAPLRRVVFKRGDRITLQDGIELIVDSVREHEGLVVYHASGRAVIEEELSHTISFSSPEERLLAGHVDDIRTFDLRIDALQLRSRAQQSPVRGYLGGRIDLIPHQLSIAGEVASRLVPRVLLADEVGLGKTIEAGLILHRLHLTGRADRVLILLPEPLVHQWFVELLRRFNLSFDIYDEERCEALEDTEPDANPFLDSQLVLCGIGLLANPRRAAQALEAGWHLLIVDEAHHLEWTRAGSSGAYKLVEALATRTPGLLLLTATPQQLGPEGHFARLRLLDPVRYSDLDRFLDEAEGYEAVAHAVDRIASGAALTPEDRALFAAHSERVRRRAEEYAAGVEGAAERLIADLLDSFGTGRVMFRNTRAALTGFPERTAHLVQLDVPEHSDVNQAKVHWLASLLRELPEEKILLICRTRSLAEEINVRLQHEINVSSALFHEGLSLIQRDRNASYFAEDDGARVLICSEIGSEGRNFQFAHHLVLFDLPADPELLEQRIGRLDRIGQTGVVNIHVPYVRGTDSEVLARWYHEGLNAFEENLHGAAEIYHTLDGDVRSLLDAYDDERHAALIERSRRERMRVADRLEHGYDRLLQLNSNKPGVAAAIADEIRRVDADRTFETYFIRLVEFFGVNTDEIAPRTYVFRPGHLLTDAFPSIPDDGVSMTFDRRRALVRDDLGFLTWDHPFVRSVMDLILGGEWGNASFAVWKTGDEDDEGMLVEMCAIIECVAPPTLHVDRFLPPMPLRVVVDDELADVSADRSVASARLRNGDIMRALGREEVTTRLLPDMLDAAYDRATISMAGIVDAATAKMNAQLNAEIERLEDLHQINSDVTTEEVDAMRAQRDALAAAIGTARLRVGALRIILKEP